MANIKIAGPKRGSAPKLNAATLALWRERMGYSQTEAAEVLGCSRNAWAGWEQGEHRVPRYIGLACAALALGMTPYGDERGF